MLWLLEASILLAIEAARASGNFSSEQQVEFLAFHSETSNSGMDSRIVSVAGSSADISIRGVITDKPDFFAMFFGGGNVTYPEIIAALAAIEQDDTIKDITLSIDSPGGTIDGLFDTIAALQVAKKPITAKIINKAASSAYAIAAQADKIVASNKAVMIGSIGVVQGFRVDESRIDIASTQAPKKRPDVKTEAGKAVVREELDPIHDLFVDAISEGRKTTAEKVNAEFGQGATLVAEEALKRGMIDSIAGTQLKSVKSTNSKTAEHGGGLPESKKMNLTELQAQHPAVYQAAVAEGITQGITQERDRVGAHLILGKASGDLDTAITAVTEGSPMTETIRATYTAAGMNKNSTDQHLTDDQIAAAALNGSSDKPEASDGSQVADILEAQLGITKE